MTFPATARGPCAPHPGNPGTARSRAAPCPARPEPLSLRDPYHFEGEFPGGISSARGWTRPAAGSTPWWCWAPLYSTSRPSRTWWSMGVVLAEDGKKMSKSARNYTDPMGVMNEFGADALRLFLMHSACVKAEDLRYLDAGCGGLEERHHPAVELVQLLRDLRRHRRSLPLRRPRRPGNSWTAGSSEAGAPGAGGSPAQMDAYDLQKAIDPIVEFIDLTNNWYIRRSRRRFWRSERPSTMEKGPGLSGPVRGAALTLVKGGRAHHPLHHRGRSSATCAPRTCRNRCTFCAFPAYEASRRDLALAAKHGAGPARGRWAGAAGNLTHNLNLPAAQGAAPGHHGPRGEGGARLDAGSDPGRDQRQGSRAAGRTRGAVRRDPAKANFKVLGKILGKDMKEAELPASRR